MVDQEDRKAVRRSSAVHSCPHILSFHQLPPIVYGWLMDRIPQVVLLDTRSLEIKVFTGDLQATEEVITSTASMEGYQMFDLVQLSSGQVGVIVGVGSVTSRCCNKAE